jgi:hypothetical protein
VISSLFGPAPLRQRFQHVLAGGHLQAAGHGHRGAVARPLLGQLLVQHETALGLHRAAEEHRLLGQFLAVQRQLDLLEQVLQLDVDGLVDDQPQRALSVCSHR